MEQQVWRLAQRGRRVLRAATEQLLQAAQALRERRRGLRGKLRAALEAVQPGGLAQGPREREERGDGGLGVWRRGGCTGGVRGGPVGGAGEQAVGGGPNSV